MGVGYGGGGPRLRGAQDGSNKYESKFTERDGEQPQIGHAELRWSVGGGEIGGGLCNQVAMVPKKSGDCVRTKKQKNAGSGGGGATQWELAKP